MVKSQPRKMYILTGGLCFPECSCCIASQKKMIERKMCFAVNMLIAISSQIQANPTIWTATQKYRHLGRVVKSVRLPAKITAYLASISQLLLLAFLYGWRFLNEISLDWPVTLTTELSTSKLSDKPAHYYGQFSSSLGKALTLSLNSTR